MPLRGLGRHTKRDASFLVSSVSGGAVPPPILGAVTDAKDAKIMMCNAAGRLSNYMILPIYLNLIKAKELDGFGEIRVGIEGSVNAKPIAESYYEKDMEATRVEAVAKA